MNIRLFALTIGAALCAGVCTAQISQPGMRGKPAAVFSIEGDVVDYYGDGIIRADVTAGSNHSTTTDSNGHFILKGFDRTTPSYEVVVQASPYTFQPDRKKIVTPHEGNVSNVRFTGKIVETKQKGKKEKGSSKQY
jgi:hypothetical protein